MLWTGSVNGQIAILVLSDLFVGKSLLLSRSKRLRLGVGFQDERFLLFRAFDFALNEHHAAILALSSAYDAHNAVHDSADAGEGRLIADLVACHLGELLFIVELSAERIKEIDV